MHNPRRRQELEIRIADGDVLIYDAEHEKVHVLNHAAGQVLDMCDGTRSAADIATSLAIAAGMDLTVVQRDVEAILEEFRTLRLLEHEATEF